MEIRKIEAGYPCHKYIVRNIKNEQDLWEYAKAFITTTLSQNKNWDDAISLLYVSLNDLSPDLKLEIPDFNSIGITSKEVCLNIMNNPAVPPFKSCNSYYKKKDGRVPCCRICHLSNNYYNKNEESEYALVKFMFSSRDNFDFASNYFDAKYFLSAMDVTLGINSQKACVVPILEEIMTSALKKNIRINLFEGDGSSLFIGNKSPFEIAFEDAFLIFPRKRRIPAALINHPRWKTVLSSTVQNKISNAGVLTQEDVLTLFDEQLKKDVEKPSIPNGPVWQEVKLSDIVEKNLGSIVSEKNVDLESSPMSTENSEQTVDPIETDNTPSSEVTSNKTSTPLDISDDNISNLSADKNSSHIDTVRGNGSGIPLPSSEHDEDEDIFRLTLSTYNQSNPEKQETLTEDTEKTHTSLAYEEPEQVNYGGNEKNLEKEDIIFVPNPDSTLTQNYVDPLEENLSIAFMKKHGIILNNNKDVPDQVKQGILRDKLMCVEVVMEGKNFYYLLWSRHSKKYYFIPAAEEKHPFYSLLSRQMVKVVCYIPYLIYGVAKLYNNTVRNIFSLNTVHKRVSKNAYLSSYISFIETYGRCDKYGDNVSKDISEISKFMTGIIEYKGIAHVLSNMLDHYEKPVVYEVDRSFDEFIGYSFLIQKNFFEEGFIGNYHSNGSYLFDKTFEHKTRSPGYFVSYTIRNSSSSMELFRYVLHALARDGHARKCNIQLLNLHANYMILYIEEYYYEYLLTIINMYFFEYSSMYPSRHIQVEQLTEKT